MAKAPKDNAPADKQPQQPQIGAAPVAAEDPSRMNATASAPTFVGFPKDKFHPVYGRRSVKDPNEIAALPGPAHNWFDSAEEADAHRTDREAQMVIHNNRMVKVDAALGAAASKDGTHGLPEEVVSGTAGVVRNSVAATESLNAGNTEPL